MTSTHSTFHIGHHAWPVPTVFLTDYRFWTEHRQELEAWCREHGAQQRGMTVTMDQAALTLFALRWS